MIFETLPAQAFCAYIPPGETANKLLFEVKLASGTALAVLFGIVLYARGARTRLRERETAGGAAR